MPFHEYWQVVPSPKPQCRQGFSQLITMGVSDILTDILLIIFPIPIILRSAMPIKRKISLVALFSLSLILIGITATRVPQVIIHLGRQQYRTVWASCEILASAAVSNAVIIGSFVRDRGVKRNKYRRGSTMDSIERASTRRPTITAINRNSDEDLFRAIGCRIPQDLIEPKSPIVRPAPAALPALSSPPAESDCSDTHTMSGGIMRDPVPPLDLAHYETPSPHDSADSLPKPPSSPESQPTAPRSVSFFDVGGLLEDNQTRPLHPEALPQATISQDFALPSSPTQRSVRNPFSSMGGFIVPTPSRMTASFGRRRSSQNQQLSARRSRESNASNTVVQPETPAPQNRGSASGGMHELKDVGGLLG